MQQALNKIQALQGVQGACIYHHTTLLASTSVCALLDKLNLAIPTLYQFFNQLESKERDYHELCINFVNYLVIIYKLHNNHLLVIVADKRVHLPMIQMGVKAAMRHLCFDANV